MAEFFSVIIYRDSIWNAGFQPAIKNSCFIFQPLHKNSESYDNSKNLELYITSATVNGSLLATVQKLHIIRLPATMFFLLLCIALYG